MGAMLDSGLGLGPLVAPATLCPGKPIPTHKSITRPVKVKIKVSLLQLCEICLKYHVMQVSKLFRNTQDFFQTWLVVIRHNFHG